MLTKSKIQGMIIGGAIGDAVGKPVETWPPEKILEVHPKGINVGKYLSPVNHKWFANDEPPGSTTDDTQLGVATLEGFIDGHSGALKGFRFDEYHHAIAQRHVDAFNETTDGWGNTTRKSVRNICNGCSWTISGERLSFGGTGNGVPMKISAFAAWFASPVSLLFPKTTYFNQQVVRHAAMTHFTDISAHAALLQTHAVVYCLMTEVIDYRPAMLLDIVSDAVWEWGEAKSKESKMYYQVDKLRKHPTEKGDSLEDRMIWLFQQRDRIQKMTREGLREKFNNGGCYVLNSLPFTYAHFLKCPHSPQGIIDVIEAGGDTDTNGKMVGEMIGALHGIEIFQSDEWKWMCEGLLDYDKLMELADRFCETFEIEDAK